MKPMEIEKKSFEIIAEELEQRYPGQRRILNTTC